MTPETDLPHFVMVGAMKCGTTTLAAQLARQDGVFMTDPKEPNFFSDDDVHARGEAWYRDLFAGAPPGDIRGEASTHYTKLPTYPHTLDRMAALLPDLRLIYMIRDPVARAVSHYIHEWSEGRMSDDAIRAFAAAPEIVDYGRYGHQIAPFAARYGTECIHLTSLEQIKADPDAEFARIAAFLGLPEGAAWVHDLPAQNVSAQRMRRLPFHDLLIDNPLARTLRHALVPATLRRRIREKRMMTARPEIPEALRRRMQDRFLEDRETLAALFPGHPALDLCYPFVSV